MPSADDATRVRTAWMLGVCIGLLFWGVIARVWFAGPEGNVGLVGLEVCTPICELRTWDSLPAPTVLVVLGFTAFLFGLKAVALAAHAFAMVLKREPVRIKRKWLVVSTAITVAASAGFLVRMLREPFSLSYPGLFAIVGGIGVLALVYRIKA